MFLLRFQEGVGWGRYNMIWERKDNFMYERVLRIIEKISVNVAVVPTSGWSKQTELARVSFNANKDLTHHCCNPSYIIYTEF